jgi:hypothetical protein
MGDKRNLSPLKYTHVQFREVFSEKATYPSLPLSLSCWLEYRFNLDVKHRRQQDRRSLSF